MAGAANSERQIAFIKEVTVGTTPATPAFTNLALEQFNMDRVPRVSDTRLVVHGGRRSAISHNGTSVSGTMSGSLFYGENDTFFESLFQDTWSTDILIDNVNETTAFTMEESIPEGAGGATRVYLRGVGCEITNCQLEFTAGQPINISFDFLGRTADASATTIIAGATYTDPSNTNALGSGSDVGSITLGAIGTADCYQTATIDFNVQGKTEQLRVSSDDLCGINRGALNPIITTRFYVEDLFQEMVDAAAAGTDFVCTFPIGSVTTEKYLLTFNSCEFTSVVIPPGQDGPAFADVEIRAKYNATDSGIVKLTRAIA